MSSLGSGDATKASLANRQPGEPVTDGRTIRLVGGEGSPYSNKMKALLTYRRIPFRWVVGGIESMGTEEAPGPVLAPKVVFPNDSVMNDSTFLIKELETQYAGRSVVPTDPRLAFLVSLIEDFGDEWVTKAMFHYRWTYDIEDAGFGIGTSSGFDLGIEKVNKFGAAFGARQVGRLGIVGSNEVTGPHIEASFERLMGLMAAHFEAGHEFLFGSRPSSADFAIYGQVRLLSAAPTCSASILTVALAPADPPDDCPRPNDLPEGACGFADDLVLVPQHEGPERALPGRRCGGLALVRRAATTDAHRHPGRGRADVCAVHGS
jgi:glutathione S-transferase